MSNEKNNNIENYLDGNMSEEELKDFEKIMQEDLKLANKVAIVKEINQTISQEAQLKAFKEQLSSLNNNYFPTTKENREKTPTIVKQLPNRNRRRWLIAASILVLAVSSLFVWNLLNSSVNSSELFAANYEPYGLGQRSGETNNNALEQQATEAYNINDFSQAIPLFEQLIEIEPSNEKNVLRLGSAYLSTNQSQKAIDVFQKIIDNPQSALLQTAQWYQALAYLQLDDQTAAKNILTQLANSGNRTYPTKATELLNAFN